MNRLFKKRIILHLHGGGFYDFYESRSPLIRKLIASTLSKADIIIVLGELLRDQFEFVPGIEAKLKVVPNGLPGELPGKRRTQFKHLQSDSIKLLYLSNMIPSKGYLDVLEACRILHCERKIPVSCDFCGAFLTTVNDRIELSARELEDAFRSKIDEKGLTDIVEYHGIVHGNRKLEMLRKADAFILPTTYPWEGQPISIIEALAFGLPVIATRYRGIPEQVINGFNGILLEDKSPKTIADAVENLWRNPNLYEQFSQNALLHFEQNFTREAHLNRIIPIILDRNA